MTSYIYSTEEKSLNFTEFFNISEKEILFFSNSKRGLYKKIEIPKRNWWIRTLSVPVYKLKMIQKKILTDILYKKHEELLMDEACWFIPSKSIINNASFHSWKNFILKLDIKDFFPSITQDRIYWLLRKEFHFDHNSSTFLSSFCTYNNQLPQWSPSSPMLANLITRFLDKRLVWLIKSINEKNINLKTSYSRYADDLTFSFNKWINVDKFLDTVIWIIKSEGFDINYKKVHLISSWKQQKVTWIVVNSKVWVWRKYYKKIKSIIYNLQVKKSSLMDEMIKWNRHTDIKITKSEKFKEVLLWHLAYIKSTSPDYYENIAKIWFDFNK